MIFIFIGKKLISLDSILPVVAELKSCEPKLSIIIVSPDEQTHTAIQKNITLHRFIQKNCFLIRLGGLSEYALQASFQKTVWALILAGIWTVLFLSNSKVIHFGLLEQKPRSFLKKGNKEKAFFFEKNCWGNNELEDQIQLLSYGKKRLADAPVKKASVMFSSAESGPMSVNSDETGQFYISPTKLWPAWREFICRVGERQWINECERLGIQPNEKVIVFLLGTLDAIPFMNIGEKTLDNILRKTLETIQKSAPETTILLKPHAITQISRLEFVLKQLESRNMHVSYLHPQIIAKHASLAVCNYYSTALIDLWYGGVETVEYTRYGEAALKMTKGGSIRPYYVDHFIDIADKCELSNVVNLNCNDLHPQRLTRRSHESFTNTDKKLIDELLG